MPPASVCFIDVSSLYGTFNLKVSILGNGRNINLRITYFSLGWVWRGKAVGLVTVSPMRILNFKSLGAVRLVDTF